MSRAKDIRDHCLDCAGGSPKEVTLCQVIACTLWPHRFGSSHKSKRTRERLEAAKGRYPQDFRQMVDELREYLKNHPLSLEYAKIFVLLEGKNM